MSDSYDPYRAAEPGPTSDPYRPADSVAGWPPAASPTQDASVPYGYAAPAPGYATPAAHPAYASPSYTQGRPAEANQLALIGFIASLVGFGTFVGFIAGIILGHIALGQIRRQPQPGRGLAIAALAIGYGGVLLAIAGVALFVILVANFPGQS